MYKRIKGASYEDVVELCDEVRPFDPRQFTRKIEVEGRTYLLLPSEIVADRGFPCLHIIATTACDLDCVYCGESDIVKRREPQHINIGRVRDVICALKEEVPEMTIGITGGEPTLHPGFKELVRACLFYGITVSINTNGRRDIPYEFRSVCKTNAHYRIEGEGEGENEALFEPSRWNAVVTDTCTMIKYAKSAADSLSVPWKLMIDYRMNYAQGRELYLTTIRYLMALQYEIVGTTIHGTYRHTKLFRKEGKPVIVSWSDISVAPFVSEYTYEFVLHTDGTLKNTWR